MPLGQYDKFFGGKPGAAAKARRGMIETYGKGRGERVFYARLNDLRGKSDSNGMRGVLRGRAKRSG